MTDDRASNSQGVPEAADVVVGPGPVLPIDAALGGPEGENGAIDGLPGRYERQAQEDAPAGLDLTQVPLGETNG